MSGGAGRARPSSGPTRPLGLIGSPSPKASPLYRLLRLFFGALVNLLFRREVVGLQNMPRTADGEPAGGWIAVGLPHRTWVEFFVFLPLLPAEPRLVMLGDGPTMLGTRWRRVLLRRVGGVVPIWRGSGRRGFEAHLEAAHRTIAAGAVFGLFPEVGRAARPPAMRRVSASVAYFALRTGAPIVPFIFGGTHELYLRRRIVVRVLAPIPPRAPAPAAGSAEEREAVVRLMAELHAAIEPAVVAAHEASEPPSGTRKIARWLTGPYPQGD